MKFKAGYLGLIQFHGLLCSLGSFLLWWTTNNRCATSFAAGSALVWVNWWLLGFSWRHLQGKKSIALSAALIVIKYPILALLCFVCLRQEWFLLGWFAAGVSTVIPAGFWAAKIGRQLKN